MKHTLTFNKINNFWLDWSYYFQQGIHTYEDLSFDSNLVNLIDIDYQERYMNVENVVCRGLHANKKSFKR